METDEETNRLAETHLRQTDIQTQLMRRQMWIKDTLAFEETYRLVRRQIVPLLSTRSN